MASAEVLVQDTSNSSCGETEAADREANENRTNLIVNYLPPAMSQEEVRGLFASIGEVESCKLVRERTTGESLGYAFVKYCSPADADKAINKLNRRRLRNKVIKVSLARPSSESIKGANLYICGLPKRMTEDELHRLFGQCGKIITLNIVCDKNTGLPRGVAFVRFDQRSEAEEAIRRLNGCVPEPGADAITVKFANNPGGVRPDSGGLADSILKQSCSVQSAGRAANPLQQLAALYRSCVRSQSGGSGGAGGISDLVAAAGGLSNSALLAQSVVAQTGALTLGGSWSIFVYNLAPDTEDRILWELFGPFGAVQMVKVIRDPASGKCRGFGFVKMSNYEEALLAIQSLNGYTIGNRTLQVSFKTSSSPKAAGGKLLSRLGQQPGHTSPMQAVMQ